MEETHEIDPDGDTYLILRNANSPFAVWDPARDDWPDIMHLEDDVEEEMNEDTEDAEDATEPETPLLLEGSSMNELGLIDNGETGSWEHGSSSGTEQEPSEAPTSPIISLDGHEEEEKPIVRFRVSSRHLILASSYFNRMLKGPWKESNIEPGCDYTISARDWDVDALLILMRIIHGQARKVPRRLSLEQLAKVAVIVDYYQCTEVVEIFAERWLSRVPVPEKPMSYRDTILRLFVSWVFSESEPFTILTARLLYSSRGPIKNLKLPIPESIIEALERDRQGIIDYVVRRIDSCIRRLYTGRCGCSYECSSMLLGVLTGTLYSLNLLPHPPEPPYIGVSFEGMTAAVREIREPLWCGTVMDDRRRNASGYLHKCYAEKEHPCKIYNLLEPRGREIPEPVGLSLETFTGEPEPLEDMEDIEEEDGEKDTHFRDYVARPRSMD